MPQRPREYLFLGTCVAVELEGVGVGFRSAPTPSTHGRGEIVARAARTAVRGTSGRPRESRATIDDTEHRSPLANTPARHFRGANLVSRPSGCRNVAARARRLGGSRRKPMSTTTGREQHAQKNVARPRWRSRASCAGLIPAAMAGASTPPGCGGGGDRTAPPTSPSRQATNGGDPAAIGAGGRGGQGRRAAPRWPGRASTRRSPTPRPTGRRVPSSSRPTTPSSQWVSGPTAASTSSHLARHGLRLRRHRRWRPDPGRADRHPPRQPGRRVPRDHPGPPQRGHHRDARRAAGDVRRGGQRQGHRRRRRLRRARHRRRHGRRPRRPGDYIGLCFIPKGSTQEAMDRDDGGAASASAARGQRPDRHGRGGPAALHARHARRVHRRRGWRSHAEHRLDDDDVDGHDAAATTG